MTIWTTHSTKKAVIFYVNFNVKIFLRSEMLNLSKSCRRRNCSGFQGIILPEIGLKGFEKRTHEYPRLCRSFDKDNKRKRFCDKDTKRDLFLKVYFMLL